MDAMKARVLVGFISALALSGCDTPMSKAEQAVDMADAADANARNALSRIDVLELKNRGLESQISSLESRLSQLESDR